MIFASNLVNSPTKVPKRWGAEYIYFNGNEASTKGQTYCMKLIQIDPGCRTSFHLHLDKHETLMVVSGKLRFHSENHRIGDSSAKILGPFEAVSIKPGEIHCLQCEGTEPVFIVEASTIDIPEDSVRTKSIQEELNV